MRIRYKWTGQSTTFILLLDLFVISSNTSQSLTVFPFMRKLPSVGPSAKEAWTRNRAHRRPTRDSEWFVPKAFRGFLNFKRCSVGLDFIRASVLSGIYMEHTPLNSWKLPDRCVKRQTVKHRKWKRKRTKRRRLDKGEEGRGTKRKRKKGLARIDKQFRVSANTFKLLIGLPFPFKIAMSF